MNSHLLKNNKHIVNMDKKIPLYLQKLRQLSPPPQISLKPVVCASAGGDSEVLF